MTDIRTYAAMLEKGIGAAFAAEKIPIHIVKTIQGPHTLTTALKLYQVTAANVRKAEKLGPSIEAHIGAGPIRVYSKSGTVLVEAPSPICVTVDGTKLQGQGLAVPIGMTSLRAVAGWDAEREPHILAVGPTGKGKTTAMRALAYHLARQNRRSQVQFIVSTFKPRDWRPFIGLAHTRAIIWDVDETVAMVEWLAREMYRRTERMVDTPHLFLFLDDLLNLLSKAPQLGNTLGDIASLGRGAGIHLVIGTQRTGKKGTGDAAVTGNITARIVFSTASAQDAALFTGRGKSGAELLGRHPGDAILITEERGIQRLAVGLITDEHMATLPRASQAAGRMPWAGSGTGSGGSRPGSNGSANGSRRPQSGSETGSGTGFGPKMAQNGRNQAVEPEPVLTQLPIVPPRPPTAEERAAMRHMRRQGKSLNAITKIMYGSKNGQTFAWVKQALADDATPNGDPAQEFVVVPSATRNGGGRVFPDDLERGV